MRSVMAEAFPTNVVWNGGAARSIAAWWFQGSFILRRVV